MSDATVILSAKCNAPALSVDETCNAAYAVAKSAKQLLKVRYSGDMVGIDRLLLGLAVNHSEATLHTDPLENAKIRESKVKMVEINEVGQTSV
ncbi:unnamed protein product [Toxocara canis]|uniref:Ketoacyl-synt_C domain-containing protein n=1 Tax=Toxocara canis TaxID=6265 RepID=A0A183U777_TOXCA|nr:unnamed protein product [Toxocara canis]